MIRILLVEDEPSKLKRIIQELVKVEGVTEDQIDDVSDVKSAKKLLKEKKYELLILDINLPKTKACTSATLLAGLEVLTFIKTNNKAIPPNHILGVTADRDVFNDAKTGFSSLIWNIIEFDFDDDSWVQPLQSSIRYLVENDCPPYKNDGKTYHINVGLICALQEELNAVLELDLDWTEIRVKHDSTKYYKGVLNLPDQQIEIVAAAAPTMGMNTSAVIAHKLISSFHPEVITMAGICAGVRDKADIGDILVADPCFEWGGGKWCSKEGNEKYFKTAPYQWRVDESLRAILNDISNDRNFLNDVYRNYEAKRPANRPELSINAMASGSSVLQSTEMVNTIIDQHKNLIGLEMESYAVYTAAALCEEPRPLCVSMKSVCDFGDETKSDGYHHYACYTSAQVFYEFIKRLYCE